MLEIYSPTGELLVGSGTSVGTILGQFTTSKNNGSITNSLLTTGTPTIFYALPIENSSYPQLPLFSFSGNTLSWTFQLNGASQNANCRVIYGVV